MSNDEFDNPDSAPLPPTDRAWRHPAERAAAHREDYQRTASPPPLSRRSTVVVAISSLVASAAILAVAVPKGISEYSEDIPIISEVPQKIKNYVGPTTATVTSLKGIASALPLGNGLFAVATDNVDFNNNMWTTNQNGELLKLTVEFLDTEIGLAVLSTDLQSTHDLKVLDELTIEERRHWENIDSLLIQDPDTQQVLTANIGFSSRESFVRALPLTTSKTLTGIALATDQNNKVIGVALRHSHSSWFLPLELFKDVIKQCLQNISSSK